MDLSNKIFLFGGFYPENVGETIKDLIAKFDAGQRKLELFMLSDGGYLSSYFALKDVIDEYGKKGLEIVTVAVGAAQSAGALLLMATAKSYVGKNTEIMIHGAQGGMFGDAELLRKYLAKMDEMNGKIADIITAKTGVSHAEALELLKTDRPFTAEQAVKYGIIDGIWNVEETVNELSKYISENMAASASPTNEVTDAMKFINSVKLPVKQNKEENMADGKNFELELQAVQTVNKDLTAKVAELSASLADKTDKLTNSEKYKVEFFNKQKEDIITTSKSLVAVDKQAEFEAKLRKFIGLDYDLFKDYAKDMIQANTNAVPAGLIIDSKIEDAKRETLKNMTDAEKDVAGYFERNGKVDTSYASKTMGGK